MTFSRAPDVSDRIAVDGPNLLQRVVEDAAADAVTATCLEASPATVEVEDLKLVATAGETAVCKPRVREARRPTDWVRGREREVNTILSELLASRDNWALYVGGVVVRAEVAFLILCLASRGVGSGVSECDRRREQKNVSVRKRRD